MSRTVALDLTTLQVVRPLFRCTDCHEYELASAAPGVWSASTSRIQNFSIWDASRDRPAFELEAEAGTRRRVPAAFARIDGRELLVCARARSVLEGYEPDSGRLVVSCPCETFAFSSLTAIGAGTHVAALGSYDAETKDSLAVITVSSLVSSSKAVSRQFVGKTGIADYAYQLLLGPCGTDAIVAFRDPEDDEEAEEPDERAAYADVWALRGLYIRQLDGRLVETVSWDGPIATGAPIAAGRSDIAVTSGDGIELVARDGDDAPAATARVARRWLAASPSGSRILPQAPDGALQLVHV